MKFLILGGAGYVGTELGARLVEGGNSVTIVDPLWFGDHFDYPVTVRQQSSFDLTSEDLIGFDGVVHLAALSNDSMAEYDPARNFILNQASVSHAAFIARRAGVRRLVYASTSSVYGRTTGAECTEDSPVDCTSAYAASKLLGEYGALSLATDEFSVLSLRKGTISGYGRRMRLDLLLNAMVVDALTSHVVRVNDPGAWRPVLGLQDALTAYERALAAPPTTSGVFNVSSLNVNVLDAAEVVAQYVFASLDEEVTVSVLHRSDPRSYRVDCAKAARELGFTPQETLGSIIENLVARRSRFQDADSTRYYNIKVLKSMSADEMI
jgi:nucleoside-diphosphate-sugar epimerase